ncbi:DUF6264 family protein [Naasia aerilata]|uniref:DUF4064 domain-containing protein n=1 Tax=Naasia aerilata TaxID=1162966 RepID=A0ABM8G932_9MICO|nr:DUF6264 family protein [Naasia aerilata]BDZ44655.1 hypothetical protein GCM10025866_05640 [Naasia aerilata]
MSDRPTSGPAPRYGEYGPVPEQPPVPPVVAEPAAAVPAPRANAAAPAAGTRVWDRLLTGVLLGLGTLNVLTGIPTMLALPRVLDEQYRAQGFGTYTSDALAAAIGVVINVVGVLLLIAAILLAVRRLRAGRLAFWVPLAAGATLFVVTGVLVVAAMLGDPALPAYLDGGAPAATSAP